MEIKQFQLVIRIFAHLKVVDDNTNNGRNTAHGIRLPQRPQRTSGEITQQLYIVFDQNNQFSDPGIRGCVSVEILKGLMEGEFGYDFSMNDGFSSQGEIKSGWMDSWENALPK